MVYTVCMMYISVGSRERPPSKGWYAPLYGVYISVGDRVRPPSKWYYAPSSLGEERAGVNGFGTSTVGL